MSGARLAALAWVYKDRPQVIFGSHARHCRPLEIEAHIRPNPDRYYHDGNVRSDQPYYVVTLKGANALKAAGLIE